MRKWLTLDIRTFSWVLSNTLSSWHQSVSIVKTELKYAEFLSTRCNFLVFQWCSFYFFSTSEKITFFPPLLGTGIERKVLSLLFPIISLFFHLYRSYTSPIRMWFQKQKKPQRLQKRVSTSNDKYLHFFCYLLCPEGSKRMFLTSTTLATNYVSYLHSSSLFLTYLRLVLL